MSSSEQPDIFISYSRRDTEFVRRLAESLAEQGKRAWLDTEGIADAEHFPDALKRAIENSDAFVFVISPDAAASVYCGQEVDYATELQKRIVPVLHAPVSDDALRPAVRDRNWIPFDEPGTYDKSLGRLLTALDTDLDAARNHTRWLLKALEWDDERRERSFLLRGSELAAAEAWLATTAAGGEPVPTELQRVYVTASRAAATRRQRVLVGASLTIAVVSLALLVFALIARGQADSARTAARGQGLASESEAELSNDPEISVILARRAVQIHPTAESLFALRSAVDASPLELGLPTLPDPGSCGLQAGLVSAVSADGQIAEATCGGVLRILRSSGQAVSSHRIHEQVTAISYAPGGRLLALGTTTGVELVDVATGSVLRRVSFTTGPVGVSALAFRGDGRMLAEDDADAVRLVTVSSLHVRLLAQDPEELGGSVGFADAGAELLVGADDGSVHVYATASGRLLQRIVQYRPFYEVGPQVFALDADGGELAVASGIRGGQEGRVSIYGGPDWHLRDVTLQEATSPISVLALSPDGTRLAVGLESGAASIWSVTLREQLASYAGATATVTSAAFLPGAGRVLTSADDGSARIWRASGPETTFVPLVPVVEQLGATDHRVTVGEFLQRGYRDGIATYALPSGRQTGSWVFGSIYTVGTQISDNGEFVASWRSESKDGSLPSGHPRLWAVTGRRLVTTLPAVKAYSVVPSANGAEVVIEEPHGNNERFVVESVRTRRSVTLQHMLACTADSPVAQDFSGDGRSVAVVDECGDVQLWASDTGRLIRTFHDGGQASSVAVDADGGRLVVGSSDSRATVWNTTDGRVVAQLIGHTSGIDAVSIDASGSRVVTAGLDDTVRIWNGRTGQELRVLSYVYKQLTVAITADGAETVFGENTPVKGVEDVIRALPTCPDCSDGRALVRTAGQKITPWLTVLERSVTGGH